MKPLLVKICGITRDQDAKLAEDLGASAIGFIFFKKSPRFVSPEQAKKIIKSLSNSVMKVGVFVNPTLNELEAVYRVAKLTHFQLHGNETPEFCAQVQKQFPEIKLIKAFRLGSPEAALSYSIDFELVDHQSDTAWGGTGQTVSWQEAALRQNAPRTPKIPLFLAGGLNATNVAEAITLVKPDGIDVSSGVEDAPGIKSELKLRALFRALKSLG